MAEYRGEIDSADNLDIYVNEISRLFIQMPPAEIILSSIRRIPGYPDYDSQKIIVNNILSSSGNFKASKRWLNFILDSIIKDIDRNEIELSDEITEAKIENLSRPEPYGQDVGFISYFYEGLKKRVSMKVIRDHNQVITHEL